MKIKYLGTAAAEGWPALFCTCKACKLAREKGGRNIRTRSQSIIDDRLLIDFSADTYWHFIKNDIAMDRIRACLITHAHEDHLYPEDFCNRRQGFAYLDNDSAEVLTVYGTEKPVQMVRKATERCAPDRVHTQALERFKTVNIEGYEVTPLDADHDPYADSVIYIIAGGGKTILYAHDTGIFPESDWEYMIGHALNSTLSRWIAPAACTRSTNTATWALTRAKRCGSDCWPRGLPTSAPYSACITSPITAERYMTKLLPKWRRKAFWYLMTEWRSKYESDAARTGFCR